MDSLQLLLGTPRPWQHQFMDHMGWFGWTLMALFWLVVILVIAVLVGALLRRSRDEGPPQRSEDRAESVLRERYARGEIDSETYQRMLDDLRNS